MSLWLLSVDGTAEVRWTGAAGREVTQLVRNETVLAESAPEIVSDGPVAVEIEQVRDL